MAFLLDGFCLLNSIAMRMFLNRSPELDARALCNFVARSISHGILLQRVMTRLAQSGHIKVDRACPL